MTKNDTSAEAVERLRKLVAAHGDDADMATLRALLRERDELNGDSAIQQERIQELLTERDAARAEVARLRPLLSRYLNETPLGHQPHMIAHEARAALAGEG